MERLVIEQDGVKVAEVDLTDARYDVGRSRDCAVRVNASDVSRQHVILERPGDGWQVQVVSSHDTKLDGTPLNAGDTAPFTPGSRLLLGKHTALRLAAPDEAAAPAVPPPEASEAVDGAAHTTMVAHADTARTGEGIPVAPADHAAANAEAEADAEAGAPPPDGDGPDHGATGMGIDATMMPGRPGEDGADDNEPKTMAFDGLQTQAVDAETLEKLRQKLRGERRRRLLPFILGGSVLIVGGGFGFAVWNHLHQKSVDPFFIRDASGEIVRQEHVFPVFDLALFGKGIYLLLPGVTDGAPNDQGNTLTTTACMRGDGSIRTRFTCLAEENPRFLRMTRAALLQEYMAGAGGDVVFSIPVASFEFLGKKGEPPGIPVDFVAYRNVTAASRGVVYLARTGAKRIVLQMETSEKDYDRIYPALKNPRSFFRVDHLLMERHWDPAGTEPITEQQARDYMDRCRQELGRLAPSVWIDIHRMLNNALRFAVEHNDRNVERVALEMLVALHDTEDRWFKSKRNDRETVLNRGDTREAIRIQEECKMVFATPDDVRFVESREWK